MRRNNNDERRRKIRRECGILHGEYETRTAGVEDVAMMKGENVNVYSYVLLHTEKAKRVGIVICSILPFKWKNQQFNESTRASSLGLKSRHKLRCVSPFPVGETWLLKLINNRKKPDSQFMKEKSKA